MTSFPLAPGSTIRRLARPARPMLALAAARLSSTCHPDARADSCASLRWRRALFWPSTMTKEGAEGPGQRRRPSITSSSRKVRPGSLRLARPGRGRGRRPRPGHLAGSGRGEDLPDACRRADRLFRRIDSGCRHRPPPSTSWRAALLKTRREAMTARARPGGEPSRRPKPPSRRIAASRHPRGPRRVRPRAFGDRRRRGRDGEVVGLSTGRKPPRERHPAPHPRAGRRLQPHYRNRPRPFAARVADRPSTMSGVAGVEAVRVRGRAPAGQRDRAPRPPIPATGPWRLRGRSVRTAISAPSPAGRWGP